MHYRIFLPMAHLQVVEYYLRGLMHIQGQMSLELEVIVVQEIQMFQAKIVFSFFIQILIFSCFPTKKKKK